MNVKLGLFIFSIFLIAFNGVAQNRVNKNGRILAKYFDLNDVTIQNVTSNKTVFTEKGGYFKMPLALNDTLVFAGENFKSIYIIIDQSDLASRFLYITLESSENTLEELVIDKTRSSNVYIEEQARKKGLYKKLYTATSGGPISKFVNFLSGRTKMIKKAIEYQNENDMAELMINSMSESYFTEDLKIPKDYIGGFGYYLLNDPDVVRAVKSNNEFQLRFLLPFKAKMYLESLDGYQQ